MYFCSVVTHPLSTKARQKQKTDECASLTTVSSGSAEPVSPYGSILIASRVRTQGGILKVREPSGVAHHIPAQDFSQVVCCCVSG